MDKNEELYYLLLELFPKKDRQMIQQLADSIVAPELPPESPSIPPGWTSVKVELPDGCDEVQLLDSTGAKGHGFHSTLDFPDDWFWHSENNGTEFTHTIIAWREFPESEGKLLKVGDNVTLTGKITEIEVTGNLTHRITFRSGDDWWLRIIDIDPQQGSKNV